MRTAPRLAAILAAAAAMATAPRPAHASLLSGEALDTAANVLSWVVLVIVPIVGIAVFWLVHILPEKIAEKRNHPQAHAIQCLCLLSLVFGGLLWPLAWLWAYTKPVFYRMAYGTDQGEHGHGEQEDETEEDALRKRVAELEARLARLDPTGLDSAYLGRGDGEI